MTKVWLVKAGHDYEGSEIVHVSSSEERAGLWVANAYEKRCPYPGEKGWEKIKKWCPREVTQFGYYDYIEVEAHDIDS